MALTACRSPSLKAMHLLLVMFLAGCARTEPVRGPSIEAESQIVKIAVEPLHPNDGSPIVLTEEKAINSVLNLFSSDGWDKNDRELVPHYRVRLVTQAGNSFTYWIGTFSDPPRFPCFWFCSGFWLASSTPEGQIDRSIYKTLATSGQMFEVDGLLSPTSAR